MGIKLGLIDNLVAFGKEADLERDIKEVGWTKTPFFSTIPSAAPTSRAARAASGHSWYYDEVPDGTLDNAHEEGGKPATPEYFEGGELKNHYQIVKNTYGVTGTEKESTRVDGKMVLTTQFKNATIRHKKSIEMILLSAQAPVQRAKKVGATSAVAGKSGGIKYFAHANNTITVANDELTWKLLRDILKLGFMKGVGFNYLMMNDTQKDVIDDIVFSKTQTSLNAKRLEMNITEIGSTAYGSNIKILLNPFMADDEIIAYTPENLRKVNWRPMKPYELARTADATEKELISEFTLRVCHPYAFAWLKGLKTS